MTNCWTTTGVCSQLGVSSGSPSGSGREASTAETLAIRDVQPFCPGMVHAAFIAQNPANFQQKLADEPAAIILHFYPLKAYNISDKRSSSPGSSASSMAAIRTWE